MSALLRIPLLLVLGLVLLWRGLMALDDRLASAGRPSAPAPVAPAAAAPPPGAPAAAAPAAAPAPLSPPTDDQLLALRIGDPAARRQALIDLRKHAVTPEALEALDDVARRAADLPEVLRFVACHRARAEGASIEVALTALPDDLEDVSWYHDAPACLIDVIAARAAEAPDRAAAVLAERAIAEGSPAAREALARLDVSKLPAALGRTADDGGGRRMIRRSNAVEAAIAMDAARKWPDRVRRWVENPHVGTTAVYALARRTDDASLAIVAREFARRPDAGPLSSLTILLVQKPGTLDFSWWRWPQTRSSQPSCAATPHSSWPAGVARKRAGAWPASMPPIPRFSPISPLRSTGSTSASGPASSRRRAADGRRAPGVARARGGPRRRLRGGGAPRGPRHRHVVPRSRWHGPGAGAGDTGVRGSTAP